MKHLFCFFTFVFIVNGQFDNVGTSAGNFLKIGVGGRATSMAGAVTADTRGPSSLYWNPAGIANTKETEIMINQGNWILDFKHNFLAAVFPVGQLGNIGISINSLDMGTMDRTTERSPDGDGTTFSASNIAIGVAYSKKISDRFNAGIKCKVIQENISFTSATALALDAGSLYLSRFSGLKIGMSITNFGTKMKLSGTDQKIDIDPYEDIDGNPDVVANLRTEEWPLPMIFRLGLSFQLTGEGSVINSKTVTNTVNLDYCDSRDLNPYVSIGVELKIRKLIYFRTGLKRDFLRYSESVDNKTLEKTNGFFDTGSYVNRMSWGVGLSSENFKYIPYNFSIDYSASDLGTLGITSQIGMTFKI